jgi:hypothetical protein
MPNQRPDIRAAGKLCAIRSMPTVEHRVTHWHGEIGYDGAFNGGAMLQGDRS